MPIPIVSSIEMPILQELAATGGTDSLRFLYLRLTAYFPQISEDELLAIRSGNNKAWRAAVQRAGKNLDDENLIVRNRGVWSLTEKGAITVENESAKFELNNTDLPPPLDHADVQELLIAIGVFLGFQAETEYQYYDVVWRETPGGERLSHVFEVQSKGNIDSAFAKLKRAYQSQRSKPYLVIDSERDSNRARQSLSREFSDMENVVTIITFAQINQMYRNLSEIAGLIQDFLST